MRLQISPRPKPQNVWSLIVSREMYFVFMVGRGLTFVVFFCFWMSCNKTKNLGIHPLYRIKVWCMCSIMFKKLFTMQLALDNWDMGFGVWQFCIKGPTDIKSRFSFFPSCFIVRLTSRRPSRHDRKTESSRTTRYRRNKRDLYSSQQLNGPVFFMCYYTISEIKTYTYKLTAASRFIDANTFCRRLQSPIRLIENQLFNLHGHHRVVNFRHHISRAWKQELGVGLCRWYSENTKGYLLGWTKRSPPLSPSTMWEFNCTAVECRVQFYSSSFVINILNLI